MFENRLSFRRRKVSRLVTRGLPLGIALLACVSMNAAETEVCAVPEMTLAGNQLTITCSTPNAEIVTTVESMDAKTVNHGSGISLSLTGEYKITSYATKDGMLRSASMVGKMYFNDVEPGAGIETAKFKAKDPILICRQGDGIKISGEIAGNEIAVYTLDGKKVYAGKCSENDLTVSSVLSNGNVYVIRIGDRSIKYAL